MPTSLGYTLNGTSQENSLRLTLDVPQKGRGRPKKMAPTTQTTDATGNTVTTTTENDSKTKDVQKTVFDLVSFSEVKLKKPLPIRPAFTSVDEAMAAIGNDSKKLIQVLYDGLMSHDAEEAKNSDQGWFLTEGKYDKRSDKPFTGVLATEAQGDAIENFITSNVAVNARGDVKSLSAEKKQELRDSAIKLLKDNPAILEAISGVKITSPPAPQV